MPLHTLKQWSKRPNNLRVIIDEIDCLWFQWSQFWPKNSKKKSVNLTSRIFYNIVLLNSSIFRHRSGIAWFLRFRWLWHFFTNWFILNGKQIKPNWNAVKSEFWKCQTFYKTSILAKFQHLQWKTKIKILVKIAQGFWIFKNIER